MTAADEPFQAALEDLLVYLEDDWCDLGWAYSLALDHTTDPLEAKETAIRVLTEGMRVGLFVAGDFDTPEFEPTSEPVDVVLDKITQSWTQLDGMPHEVAHLYWLDLTPTGQALAEKIIAERDTEET